MASEQEALQVISNAVDQSIERLRQKLAGELGTIIGGLLGGFKNKLATKIIAQQREFNKDRGHYDFTLMPIGTRLFKKVGEEAVLIVEQTPTQRVVSISPYADGVTRGLPPGVRIQHLELALPYVLFAFHLRLSADGTWSFNKQHTFWRKSPLRNELDELNFSWLPNAYSDSSHGFGRICTGETNYKGTSICERVEERIAHYWQAEFTTDLTDQLQLAIRNEQINSLYDWADRSKKNPTFILKSSFRPACRLSQFVESVIGTEQLAYLNRTVEAIVHDLSWELTENVKASLNKIDVKAFHKSKFLVRLLADYIEEQVKAATANLNSNYENRFSQTLADLERKENELVAKILAGDLKPAIPKAIASSKTDLSNPW